MAYQPVPSSGSGSGTGSGSGFHYWNSPFGDTTFTKVFVGGLAWETQSDTLHRYFEQFGEILEAVVITDKNTGRSKGYGFVTFRDPEATRRACVDPSPIIDGRRANCNLASLGRPRPPLPYGIITNFPGRVRPASPYIGGMQSPRGALVGNFPYQQSLPYGYQQGLVYPSYGNAKIIAEDLCPSSIFIEQARLAAYGLEYIYSQGLYNPYVGQQYLQVYGVPETVNTAVYPYGQIGQTIPSGHGYSSVHQGYTVPGNQVVQFTGPGVSSMTASTLPTIQAPYPAGIAAGPVPVQPQFIVQAPSQFLQGSDSDQTTG